MKHKGLFEECISRERAQAKVINELLTGSNNGPVSLQFITETGKHYWDKRNYIVWVILNTVEFGLVQKKCDHWSPVVRSLHRLPVKLRSQTCNSWFWDPACSDVLVRCDPAQVIWIRLVTRCSPRLVNTRLPYRLHAAWHHNQGWHIPNFKPH